MKDQYLDISQLREQLQAIIEYEHQLETNSGIITVPKILDKFPAPKFYNQDFECVFEKFYELFHNEDLMKEFGIVVETNESRDITGVFIDKFKFMKLYSFFTHQALFLEYFRLAEQKKIEILYGPIKGYVNPDGTPYEDFLIQVIN